MVDTSRIRVSMDTNAKLEKVNSELQDLRESVTTLQKQQDKHAVANNIFLLCIKLTLRE